MPGLNTDRTKLTLEAAIFGIAALSWQEDEQIQLEGPVDWGRFEGDLVVRFLDDGRLCQLLQQYCFVQPDGSDWPVPPDAKVDGASIPRLFWTLIGGPFEGKYRNASVIHDFYCDTKKRPWRDTHRMFHDAMRCQGVTAAKAKVMYYAVYRFGPRWAPAGQPSLESTPLDSTSLESTVSTAVPLTDASAPSLLADAEAIYVHDLSLDEIERLAEARNAAPIVNEAVPGLETRDSAWIARARSLVVCGGSGTQDDLEAVASESERLPEFVVKRFERERIRIVACRESVTDFETDLKGKVPRGWESTGKTWDSVPGTYFQDRRRVVIATIEKDGVRSVPTKASGLHGSANLVVHESLHGFDYAGGHAILDEPTFQSARQADLSRLGAALNGYLVQEGRPGLEETFAESGARFAADEASMRSDWPNLHGYWGTGPAVAPEFVEPRLALEGARDAGETSIGMAAFRPDGAVDLDLRAEGPGGAIGHAFFSVTPDDEAYASLRAHLLQGRVIAEGAGDLRVPFLVPGQ